MSSGLVAFPVADLWQVEPLVRTSTFEMSTHAGRMAEAGKDKPAEGKGEAGPSILRSRVSRGCPVLSARQI